MGNISTAYGSHYVRPAYVLDSSMILHTVFMMLVDLKAACQTILRHYRKEGHWHWSRFVNVYLINTENSVVDLVGRTYPIF